MAAKPKRQRIELTEDWHQLDLLSTFPEQRAYELIRPVVLFGHSAAERARQTGTSARTLARRAQDFAERGMASFFPLPKTPATPRVPIDLRELIRSLKAEYPALNQHEIATICYIRMGRRPSHHTVKRILAATPPQPVAARRYPPFHQVADPAQRRLAIIRLHIEGWNAKSIAGYLEISRTTVHTTLRRWSAEGFRGLPDKSHAPLRPKRKVTFHVLTTVRRLQRNPGLGEFRMSAALKQLGIRLSPRTCGRLLALNRDIYGGRATIAPKLKQLMPFRAQRRHQYWSVYVKWNIADTRRKLRPTT